MTVDTTAASDRSDLPAVLGGHPLRPGGPPGWPAADPEVADVLARAAADGSWGRYHGPHAEALAEALASACGLDHVILCSSGTAAVELALRGLKVGDGDEVVLAAYDFRGNLQDVLCVGGVPVLVDVASPNWNLDPDRLEQAITDRTRAILVSHLHGGLVPMPAVREIADRHSLPLIEDACQVPGATAWGRPVGCWGDVGVLSFGGSKLLSAGRGGALLTNDDGLVQRIRLYTHRGNQAYPLSELQAAVLLPQLEKLDGRNERRAEAVGRIVPQLLQAGGLQPFQNPDAVDCRPGYYKLGLKYDPSAFEGLARDGFSRAMRAEGIALDPGFRSLHRSHSQRRFRAAGSLSEADAADDGVLVLHHPVLLGTDDEIDQVVEAVEKIRRHAAGIRDAVPAIDPQPA